MRDVGAIHRRGQDTEPQPVGEVIADEIRTPALVAANGCAKRHSEFPNLQITNLALAWMQAIEFLLRRHCGQAQLADFTNRYPYDFLIERGGQRVTIQVKMQRREKGVAKPYGPKLRKRLSCPSGDLYVVEVQKTRTGEENGEDTRPYRFGDFNILAVNMQASTGKWEDFMYTVGTWLIPRAQRPELIEIFQPVAKKQDACWTDDLNECIEWFRSGEKKSLYANNEPSIFDLLS